MWKVNKFNRENCLKFVKNLADLDVAYVKDKTIIIKPPFTIEIPTAITSKIVTRYKSDEERGGLMFGYFKKVEDLIVLEIKEYHEIENYIETYRPEKSKRWAYFPHIESYTAALENNFCKVDGDVLFPIHYHTHPSKELEPGKHMSTATKLELSEADKNSSDSRFIEIDGGKLQYLNAIITGNESENRIVFYGKDVTDYDFSNNIHQQALQGILDSTAGIESTGGKIGAIGLGFGALLLGIFNPEFGNEAINLLPDLKNEKEYFGTISRIGATKIKIPKYQKN